MCLTALAHLIFLLLAVLMKFVLEPQRLTSDDARGRFANRTLIELSRLIQPRVGVAPHPTFIRTGLTRLFKSVLIQHLGRVSSTTSRGREMLEDRQRPGAGPVEARFSRKPVQTFSTSRLSKMRAVDGAVEYAARLAPSHDAKGKVNPILGRSQVSRGRLPPSALDE